MEEKDLLFWCIKYLLIYIYCLVPQENRTEKADFMPSHNLEKKTLKQGWGYKIEAESSSKKPLPREASCRLWLSAKLSSRLCKRALRGCPTQLFPARSRLSQGKAGRWEAGKGNRVTAWVPCPALCYVGWVTPEVQDTAARPSAGEGGGRKEEHAIFVFITITQIRRRKCLKRFSLACIFSGRLIFYCWAWTMKRSGFLFLCPHSTAEEFGFKLPERNIYIL